MKIVHILSADSGGAGLAALRLHQALLASNIDSHILCFYKQSKVPHVVCVERTTCTKILMRLPIPFKNGKYKKVTDTKKTKYTFKKTKGTYYVKLTAYVVKSDKATFSKATKPVKFKVK